MQSKRVGLSFSHSPISLLLRQPLSIKKSYAGAIQDPYPGPDPVSDPKRIFSNILDINLTFVFQVDKLNLYFLIEHFLLRNCQILSVFLSSFTSN